MKKKYEKVYCHGNLHRGDDVIDGLIAHGAKNTRNLSGQIANNIYYIAPDNTISYCAKDGDMSLIIKNEFREIKIKSLSRWRAEKDEIYYTVTMTPSGATVSVEKEHRSSIDDDRYKLKNYFRNSEKAKKFAENINNIFISQ